MIKPLSTFKVCLLLFFFLLFCAFHLRAQRYDLTATSGTFTPLVGGTPVDIIEDDDAISSTLTLPGAMTFNYFGTTYTQFKVSSNGFLTFDLTSGSNPNNLIAANFEETFIAPLWDDLSGTGGSASYQVSGTAPNQVFTFEWLNWKWGYAASAAGISFQLKLYESTNKIEFIYQPEAGSLDFPSASIGMVYYFDDFYSLSNSSASPILEPAGVNTISTKPANGQVYSFTPNPAAFVAPTTQATNVTPAVTTITANLSWTNGDGTYRAVFVKQTASTSETVALTNNGFYRPNSSFGTANTQVGSSGWYCVYNSTGNSVNVTNLIPGTPYRIQVVEYNGTSQGQKYNTASATNNPVNMTTTAVVPPTAPISTVVLKHKSSTQVTFEIVDGNGEKKAVFMKAASSGTSAPVDNTTYTANTVFGSGAQIGSTGWYCVFNGSSLFNLTVTGLSANTTYTVHVVDYNGIAGFEKYFASTAPGNPVQVTTFVSMAVPTYTLVPSAGSFTPLSGGVAVDAIEVDDGLSAALPIGFTFYHAGIPFTELKASSNGFLTFNSFETNPSYGNALSDGLARPLVAPLWDDLSGSGGQASYSLTGTAPNRVFTFEWLNWKWDYNATAGISFQVSLYEADNKVSYTYRQEAGTLSSPSASIGMAFPETGSGNYRSLTNSSANPVVNTGLETTSINTKPASGQIYAFTPQKYSQTITFGALAVKTVGDADFNLTATASSTLPVSYTSSNTSVATVSGNTVTIVGGGFTVITASQAGNSLYAAAVAVPQTLTVNKLNQTITFGALPAKNFGDPSFALTATASSSLPVTYTSSNTSVATISGSTLTIVGGGVATITASQAGNSTYAAAAAVQQTLTVNQVNQTISFAALAPRKMSDGTFTLAATATSGLTVSYSSSNTSVATIAGNTVTLVGVGSADITASQAGNASYFAATNVVQALTVTMGDQTISFASLTAKAVGDPAFSLEATATSGLPVTYSSSNGEVATISGSTVTIVGAGTTTVTATQAGNANYNSAPNVQQSLVVNKGNQVITFSELPVKTTLDAAFGLAAFASSGLPITFSSSNVDVATVSGSTVSIVGAGTTNLTATQAGSDNYNPATAVRILTVTKADQVITFPSMGNRVFGDAPFALSATSSSGLPVSYSSSNTNVATVAGSTVTIVGAGDATISATQPGNSAFNQAVTVVRSLTVGKANQSITFAPIVGKTLGDSPFTVEATASSGLPITNFSMSSSVPEKATVAGNVVTILSAGSATIHAFQEGNQNYFNRSQSLTFCINPPKPTITSQVAGGTFQLRSSDANPGAYQWQWYKNAAAIAGATSSSFTVTEPGNYTAIASKDNCSSVPSDAISIPITGLESWDEVIQIYPNPVDDEMVVAMPPTQKAAISIIDLLGRTVGRADGTGTVRVDVSRLSGGVYVVLVQTEGVFMSRRMHKK